jgi:uncharacterized protein DUF4258
MEYELSDHARKVIAEREILIKWIETVLQRPEHREADPHGVDLTHLLARIAAHGNRVLRVVVNEKTTPIRVVTAYFDRKMKSKL